MNWMICSVIFNQGRDALEVYSLVFIVGAVFGSFLNVAILRLPLNQSIVTPRSSCPHCKTNIAWYHNIPLLSFLCLKAKCAHCQAPISWQYFVVELFTAIVTLALFFKVGMGLSFVFLCLLFYSLIVLAFIDLKYKAVPDYILLLALVLAFVSAYENIFEALRDAFLFAGFFALLEFVMTFYVQNIKSKLLKDESLKEARSLGEGDIPIVAIIGIVLGWQSGILAIFFAAIFAIIPSIYYNYKKKESQLPFIPYLLMGMAFEYFFEISKVFH